MGLKKFIGFEFKKVIGKAYIIVSLVFLAASGYLFYHGLSQYKHIVEENNYFKEFEQKKYKLFLYPSYFGTYGCRLRYEPSPFMAIFDSGPFGEMTAFIDGSERMTIYQPLIGQSAFTMLKSAFMTFSGFIMMFGSGLILLYGFSGSKDHDWLKFLEELAGSRFKLFLYHLISRTVILLLYCLSIALLSVILFLTAGVPVNIDWILIYTMGTFVMLFCFLFGGLIAGTLKNRLWGGIVIGITWFVLTFVITMIIYHMTYDKAGSIKSPFKMETVKLKLFQGYEKGSLEKGGLFDKSKYGDENEARMFMNFWNGDFKKIMKKEEEMLAEMEERISFHQTTSAYFPSTFFLSSSNEMSSRGFANLVGFNEYTQEKKKELIWFIADIYILSNKVNEWKELTPFPKENENIYKGQIRLPGNYSFGMAISFIWLIVLFSLYRFMFNRMLDRAQGTQRELNPDDLKKDKTNIMFTSDKGLLPQLISKLRSQNIPFLYVPGPDSLPGDTKVKNLFSFFGLAIPEALQEIAAKYIYALEPDQKGMILSEITRSLKADVLIFDNFLAGLSDDIIHHFAGVLNSLKKGRIIVYFTNSLMVTAVICDCGIKWTNEKIPF
ncbi:MAG: hypothetical protein JSV88_27475 [Candidatus Aminicenantes bacterium]|nr:MAG: hypothetical protein JSV88_27475 [Candidatus Aminicenantes bacterium]